MTALRILIYTDSFDIAADSDEVGHGTSILKKLLETKTLAFADFKVDVINRYEGFDAMPPSTTPRKLTEELLKPYDELWLFGWYQARVEQDFEPKFGGRDNELDPNELKELEKWMASGGVLISGDHSEYAPGGKETDPIETFLCLGRALGYQVPRAHALRQWVGPFTNQASSSFNTLVRTATEGETVEALQTDPLPQSINLLPIEQDGSPHQIFLGTNTPIRILPDHAHEGKLIIPSDLSAWPPATDPMVAKPEPTFVAMGCDKRSCESYPVLTIYDGDSAGVGRIVADSSWHHYLNKNLKGLTDTGALDLLRQLFHNIALYLAPFSKRQTMMREMLTFFLRDPEVQEERGNSPYIVGRVALENLSAISTGCEIDELFRLALPPGAEVSRENFASPRGRATSVFPTRDVAIGAIINRFYQAASERLAATGKESVSIPPALTEEEIIAAGLEDALKVHIQSLRDALSESPKLTLRLANELHLDQ